MNEHSPAINRIVTGPISLLVIAEMGYMIFSLAALFASSSALLAMGTGISNGVNYQVLSIPDGDLFCSFDDPQHEESYRSDSTSPRALYTQKMIADLVAADGNIKDKVKHGYPKTLSKKIDASTLDLNNGCDPKTGDI